VYSLGLFDVQRSRSIVLSTEVRSSRVQGASWQKDDVGLSRPRYFHRALDGALKTGGEKHNETDCAVVSVSSRRSLFLELRGAKTCGEEGIVMASGSAVVRILC
jgi:hypothetical protein